MRNRRPGQRSGASPDRLLADAFRRCAKALMIDSPRDSRDWDRVLARLARADPGVPLLTIARRVTSLQDPSAAAHPEVIVFLGLLAEALPNELEPARALALGLASVRAPNAEQALASVLARIGSDGQSSIALGRLRLERGAPREALADFERAEASGAEIAQALFGQGLAWLALDEHSRAADALAAARDRAPRDGTVTFHLALALRRRGEPDAALAVLDALIAREPRHARAWFEKGNLLQDAGRHGEAIAAFDEALAADPSMASAAFNQALSQLAERRLDAAMDAFGRSIQLDTSSAGPVAQALTRESAGCLWLDPVQLAQELSGRVART